MLCPLCQRWFHSDFAWHLFIQLPLAEAKLLTPCCNFVLNSIPKHAGTDATIWAWLPCRGMDVRQDSELHFKYTERLSVVPSLQGQGSAPSDVTDPSHPNNVSRPFYWRRRFGQSGTLLQDPPAEPHLQQGLRAILPFLQTGACARS